MKAIVITFDRLPAEFLSCYGNEWIETPALDRLAARAAVFEQHFAEIPSPAGPNHPWWTGRFEFFSSGMTSNPAALTQLRAAGVKCHLIAESLEGLPAELFDHAEAVSGADGLDAASEDVPFARAVQRACEVWQKLKADENALVWVHSRGIPTPWMPPQFFAELYLEELIPLEEDEDSEEPDEQTPAARRARQIRQAARDMLEQLGSDEELRDIVLSADLFAPDVEEDEEAEPAAITDDPEVLDLLHRMSRLLFGSYVTLIDHWLGRLLDACWPKSSETLLMLSAACGQSLNERADFLPPDLIEDHTSELVHAGLRTPLLVLRGDSATLGTRHHDLVQTPDLAATLLDWFQATGGSNSDGASLLRCLDANSDPERVAWHFSPLGEIGLRTSDRLLRGLSSEEADGNDFAERPDLPGLMFVKPEDIWDLCNVAAQEPAEHRRLLVRLAERLRANAVR